LASRGRKTGNKLDIAGAFAEALAHQNAGAWPEVAAVCRRILAQDRGNPQAEGQLAQAQYHMGDHAGAARRVGRLLRRHPNEAMLHNLSALALRALGQDAAAAAAFQRVIALQPTFAAAYNNLGTMHVGAGRFDEAVALFERATTLAPERPQAWINLVEVLIQRGDYDAAAAAMAHLLDLAPGDPRVRMNHYALLTRSCDWAPLPEIATALDGALADALAAGRCPTETPLINLSRKIDAAENLAVARAWAADIARRVDAAKPSPRAGRRRRDDARLRLGYLSADFRDHPVAHLLGGMFARHDRTAFHVTAYTHGPDDDSAQRRRIGTDCDAVVDIAPIGDADAAARIAADGIDILVDLMGHTGRNRLGIPARRPAPVQVTWLGFPGATGAAFVDYILTDRVVTPPDAAPWCTEQPVYLPHCYQVNDRGAPEAIDAAAGDRAAHGLPATGIVFCSFNQHFKYEPVMAGAWMAILQDVPDAVLWLSGDNPRAESNLRCFAEAHCVDGGRLHFAAKLPQGGHLARLAVADIGLDTRIYNGHTTTSDLLWMGVPVITLRGSSFASRVAASILTAHGVPDLIADDLAGYRTLAVELARDAARLQSLKRRVAENRTRCPLFDGARFVEGLERAYREIWAIHQAGESPRPIDLTRDTPGST